MSETKMETYESKVEKIKDMIVQYDVKINDVIDSLMKTVAPKKRGRKPINKEKEQKKAEMKAYFKEYYNKNKDKFVEYYKKNREEMNEKSKRYYRVNKINGSVPSAPERGLEAPVAEEGRIT